MAGMVFARTGVARAAAMIVAFFAVVLPADPASAHAVLVRTSPAADTVVAAVPLEIVLTFSEPVAAVPGKLRVIGPDGQRADAGDPVSRGAVLAIPLRTGTPRGTYLASYRVISTDGHPIGGGFTFSVGEPSAPPTDLGGEGTTDPVVGALVPVAKYLGYVGLVLIAGPVLVLALLWPRRLSRDGPIRLAWIGLGLTAFATLASLVLQVPYTSGASLTGISRAGLRDVLGSTFGTAMLVRLGVLAAAAFLLRPLLSGVGGTADRAILAVLAVVGLATWPLAGHPAASPVPLVTVLTDSAHLAGMAVWLGGLVMLMVFLLRRAQESELAAILPIWSRWAALAVSVLILAGTLQALVEVASPKALVTTTYGWLVIAKVSLVALVLGVAAMSRRLVRTGVAGGRPAPLRRLVAGELMVAAVVLGVAAALVQTTPARTAAADQPGSVPQPFSTTVTDRLYTLQVDVDPAETGSNSVHLFAYTPDGKPRPVAEWKATAELASAGVGPIDIPLLKITDNHSIGDITLPTKGAWEFRFTLRVSDIDRSTVATTVQIR